MSFDRVIPLEEFIQGDARHSWYEGGVTTDWLQARCLEMRISPVVPDPVKHQLLLAKQLRVVGYFYRELYSVAIHYATTGTPFRRPTARQGVPSGFQKARPRAGLETRTPSRSSFRAHRAASPFPTRARVSAASAVLGDPANAAPPLLSSLSSSLRASAHPANQPSLRVGSFS